MTLAISSAVSLLISAVSLSTPTVPAQGRAEALLTLDRAAMVRVKAVSDSGTACEVVDRVRGPFARSGVAGKESCLLDLLLDAGSYKLRLESARRGKGTVKLSAAELTELTPLPQRLVAPAVQTLKVESGQQAAFWVTQSGRAPLMLRISGRTAGRVELWRDGQWVEHAPLEHHTYSPEPGRPLHEWWLTSALEDGDWLVRVYGTDAYDWAGGAEHSEVELELGLKAAPASRALPFTLGRSGIASVSVPAQPWAALLSLEGSPAGAVELGLDQPTQPSGGACRIEKKALVPQCAGFVTGTQAEHVLTVRGPAGTKGLLEWAEAGGEGSTGGYYGSPVTTLPLRTDGGLQLVGLDDLPADGDAAPLGCQLMQGTTRVAWDFMALGDGKKLDAQFNSEGNGVIWFDVKRAGRYRIEALGGRKSRCELYRLDAHAELQRLSQTTVASGCTLTVQLSEGSHQLSLFDGNAGIEHLVIREEARADAKPVPVKTSCLLPAVPLGDSRYELQTNRTGALTARGLVVARLPLTLEAPLHLTLDPGQKVSLPLAMSLPYVARFTSGAEVQGGGDRVELENPSAAPVHVMVMRPEAVGTAPTRLQPHSPAPEALRTAKADAPVFFDFEPNQSRSMLFEVEKAGLYHVSTQGLLATRCALRTAVNPEVAVDTSSGRGRNCLVAGYLRPGRYLMTVTPVGSSRGRASVLLTRRPVRVLDAVGDGAETFFHVDAGDLVQQKLTFAAPGTYAVSTTAQGASLRCRLDDSDGWPLTTVPTSCNAPRTFAKGSYVWTQLPLGVESLRHTRVEKERAPPALAGNQTHALDFFTWYQARLGPDGRDELTFTLEGPAELDIVLTQGVQGRLFSTATGQPIALIASTERVNAPPREEPAEGDDEPDYGADLEPEREDDYRESSVQPIAAADAPLPPQGVRVSLAAGSYRLVTEHSRGDVGIDYQVHLGSAVLLPGMTRSLPTPARVAVSVPRDGTLRLRTRGEADVRCRLFDRAGALVLESSANGPDWNCSAAEPVSRGEYVLVLESETQSRSTSKLSLSLAAVEARPAASAYTLGASVLTVAVPPGDAVQELAFEAKTRFSCALEGPGGVIAERRSQVTVCRLRVRPKSEAWRVRLWTTGSAATLSAAFAAKPASVVSVASPGRYRTAAGVGCLPASQTGPLRDCGPEVSLEAQDVAFSEPVGLEEVTATDPSARPLALAKLPFLLATVARDSVALLEAHAPPGERAAPSCAFATGGAREARDADCFAASNLGPRAVARLWAATEEPMLASTRLRTVSVPATRDTLRLGRQPLTWSGGASRWALPKQRARVSVVLAPQVWAVLLDDAGKAVDLCAPGAELTSCAFTARGGTLLLTGDRELRATADVVLLDVPERSAAFTGLYEELPRLPGTLALEVPAALAARTLLVEGAERCVVTLSDGTRLTGCRAELPASLSASLRVDHGAAALRVIAFEAGAELRARLGFTVSALPGAPLAASTAIALKDGRSDRTLVLDREAVVHVSAAAGVCAVLKGNELLAVDGLEHGCELVRVLGPGTYRAIARPFAQAPSPAATLEWTAEPVTVLTGGVGPEDWLAPAATRLYRFTTAARGNVGLGLQTRDEALDCAIYDESHQLLAEGCQQFLVLEKGSYLLSVHLPVAPGAAPLRIKPVLLGLARAKGEVPQAWLEDFFRRTESHP